MLLLINLKEIQIWNGKSMNIHYEKESDVNVITKIHDLAFEGKDEGIIVNKLRESGNLTISLVYESDECPVGHIAYSPISNQSQEIVGIGLAPVGILPEFQNQGIGSALIEEGNKMVQDLGYDLIFVLGDPQYYLRFGFELARDYNYFCDYDPIGNHFMVQGCKNKKVARTIVNYTSDFEL